MVQVLIASPRLKLREEDQEFANVMIHTAEDVSTFSRMLSLIVYTRIVIDLDLFQIRTRSDFNNLQKKLATLGVEVLYLISPTQQKVLGELSLLPHELVSSQTITVSELKALLSGSRWPEQTT